MIAKDNDGGTYEPIPEDLHLGICVGVVDLGTQHNYKFDKYERKCLITWELPNVRTEFEERDVPRWISRRFTLSLGSNSHLRKFLRTWRGKDFTLAELKGFEIKTLLGVHANIQVLHSTSTDGTKVYSNVDSAAKLMVGQEKPEPESPLIYFSFDHVSTLAEVDAATDDMLEWVQELIQKSVEYNNLAKANGDTSRNDRFSEPTEEGTPVPDDDIPF